MVPPGCPTVDRRADIVAAAARRGVVGPQVDAKLMMTHASSDVCDVFTSEADDERTRLLLSQIDDTAEVGAAAICRRAPPADEEGTAAGPATDGAAGGARAPAPEGPAGGDGGGGSESA